MGGGHYSVSYRYNVLVLIISSAATELRHRHCFSGVHSSVNFVNFSGLALFYHNAQTGIAGGTAPSIEFMSLSILWPLDG